MLKISRGKFPRESGKISGNFPFPEIIFPENSRFPKPLIGTDIEIRIQIATNTGIGSSVATGIVTCIWDRFRYSEMDRKRHWS